MMNRKAQAPTDVILIFTFICFIAIGAIIFTFVYQQMNVAFQADPILNATQEQRDAFDIGDDVSAMWDYILLTLTIGSAIVLFITAYFVDVHSVFMVLYIIGLILGEMLTAILSYIWHTVSTNTTINTVLYLFPITDNLLNFFPYYFAIIGVIAMVITYAKDNAGG